MNSESKNNQVAPDFAALVDQFAIRGDFAGAARHGSGHIHDTYKVTCQLAGQPVHYILQRINHTIFKDPAVLMENIQRVTTHLHAKLRAAGGTDLARRALTIIPTRVGGLVLRDDAGQWWRMYVFIERARTFDQVETEQQVYEAARAFAQFQGLLADLPAPRLHDTIPNFHNAVMRLAALRAAVEQDPQGRAAGAQAEIAFVEQRAALCARLLDRQQRGELPERITHNDTKFNNIMLDEQTNAAVCVIDLDIVMPGLALYDFGDMVRTATAAALEDERDLTKVFARPEMFAALARGYLSEARFLTAAEREELVFSGRLITLVIGIRFLTDHLLGDAYFKIHRPNHNLDRCRTQFKMVASLEAQADTMEKIVADAFRRR
jgi:hypothetical protein